MFHLNLNLWNDVKYSYIYTYIWILNVQQCATCLKIVWQIHKFFKSKYKMIFILIFQSCSYFSFRVNKKAASFYLLIFNPVCSRKDLRHYQKICIYNISFLPLPWWYLICRFFFQELLTSTLSHFLSTIHQFALSEPLSKFKFL